MYIHTDPSLEGDRLEVVAHIWDLFSRAGRRFTIVAWGGRVPSNIEVCLEKNKNHTIFFLLCAKPRYSLGIFKKDIIELVNRSLNF